MGLIGFLDDYIKVYKKNKKGLAGRFKILGQVGLGLIVGCAVYLHPDIYVKQEIAQHEVERFDSSRISSMHDEGGDQHFFVKIKEPVTNIPFFKGNEFNHEAPFSLDNEERADKTICVALFSFQWSFLSLRQYPMELISRMGWTD